MKSAVSSTSDYGVILVRTHGHMYEVRVGSPNREPQVIAAGTLRAKPASVVVNDLRLDTDTHQLTLAGKEVHLTPTEESILERLMSDPTRSFSSQELVAGTQARQHTGNLRKKLGGDYIKYRRGRGWSLL